MPPHRLETDSHAGFPGGSCTAEVQRLSWGIFSPTITIGSEVRARSEANLPRICAILVEHPTRWTGRRGDLVIRPRRLDHPRTGHLNLKLLFTLLDEAL